MLATALFFDVVAVRDPGGFADVNRGSLQGYNELVWRDCDCSYRDNHRYSVVRDGSVLVNQPVSICTQ